MRVVDVRCRSLLLLSLSIVSAGIWNDNAAIAVGVTSIVIFVCGGWWPVAARVCGRGGLC